MEIKRQSYLNKLVKHRHNGLVKVVTGLRRCGKSYLLFNLFKRQLLADDVKAEHIIEVALDDDSFESLRDPRELSAYIRKRVGRRRGRTYVLIDEIQMCEEVPSSVPGSKAKISFYDVLNGLMKLPGVDIYVTGSNSQMLSMDVATNFRDRGFEIRLHPLSFSEYVEATGKDAPTAFEDYITWGGMPLAVLEEDDDERSRYLKGLFERVYVKDICERHGIQDDYVLNRVVDAVSSSVGSLTNPHKLVNTLRSVLNVKTNDHVLNGYLGYLCDAFLFSKVLRYDVKGKSYFDTPHKYFAEDVGLRNARLNFRQVEEDHLVENVIYNELAIRGYNVDVGVVPIASRTGGRLSIRQHEIDFVVNLGSKKLYIQSAFSVESAEKREQETLPLRKSGDFFRKIVVVGGMKRLTRDESGIEYVGVIPFLLNPALLEGES